MNCELLDGRCQACGWEVPERLRGRTIFRTCGKREPDYVPPASIPDPKSCSNRGDLLRVEECKPCQAGGRVPEIFACVVHGECTLYSIGKRKPDGSRWKSCSTCDDIRE